MIYKGYAGLKGKKCSKNVSGKCLKNRCLATTKLIICSFAVPNMTSWHGFLFRESELFLENSSIFWKKFRIFACENKTIFELFFIFLYFLEQVLLIIFSYSAKSLVQLSFIVSIFALIVLSTFSIHKVLMESRIKYLEKELTESIREKQLLEKKTKTISEAYNNLFATSRLITTKALNLKSLRDKTGKRERR